MDTKLDTSLRIVRTLDAVIENVFDAWVQPEALTRWFAPSDAFTTEVHELDPRPKGRYRISMTEPDGKTHTVNGIYEIVDRPSKLVFSWAWESEISSHRSTVAINLKRKGGQTELTLIHSGFETAESAKHHEQGWYGCLGRLAAMFT